MLSTFPYSTTNPSLLLDYVPAPRPDASPSSSSSSPPFIFYVHGGGFLAGNRHTATPYMYGLAYSLNIPFVSVDYRLCPDVSLEEGCTDVQEAWKFVTAPRGQGGLSDKVAGQGNDRINFEAANAIVLGASAGSFYALKLLLHLASQSPPHPRPRAFVNFYGGVHLDPQDLATPKPLPHPLLDQPGGFPPLNAFVQHRFEEITPGQFKIKQQQDSTSTPASTEASTGSHLSLLESLKANGFITSTQDFHDTIWLPNGLDEHLYTATNAHKGLLDDPADYEPISRVLLLFWAIRNATLAVCLNGPKQVQADTDRQQINSLALNDHISQHTFPPTFTLHGTADLLVPHQLSEAFHATLLSKGVEAVFASAPEEIHTLDMRWIVGKYEKVGNVAGGAKPQELFEKWIAEKVAT